MGFTENQKEYTDDEMIIRAWDKEVIMDQVGRFVLFWSSGERQRIIDELYVSNPDNQKDASFATNIGFYVGIDEVKRHLVDEYNDRCKKQKEKYLDSGIDYATDGIGICIMHSATTPVLFVADDGKSARVLVYDLGMSAEGNPDGTAKCYHEVGLLLIELLKENDCWKIWHIVEEHDFTIEAGKDYNEVPTVIKDADDPSRKDFGNPTVKKDVYDNQFGWEYLFYDMPAPYKTYADERGYGVNGIVGKKYYERIY
ncbi:MAG: hypothetical protein K6G40_02205 [Eubacterium sp.]|nr:hypothetical protein [Eubacterium sp.]